MLDVTSFLRPERSAFLELLRGLNPDQWSASTECPGWSVKGIALHVLGDDFSLLSRQRDEATNGLLMYAMDHPGLNFFELLSGFNEQWVHAAQFFSTRLVVELLGLTGVWTGAYYGSVELTTPGEPVGFFGETRQLSPWWQVAAREYVERWIHHSQICRALDLPNVSDELSAPAIEAVALGFGARIPELGRFTVGDRSWDFREGAAVSIASDLAKSVLSRALTREHTMNALVGERTIVEVIAAQTCRDAV